jgi:hypothetical protein
MKQLNLMLTIARITFCITFALMKNKETIREIFNKAVLVIILVASFNLSFHVKETEAIETYANSSIYLDDQEFLLLPFGQQEATAPLLQLVSTASITLPEWQAADQWIPLVKTTAKLQYFYRQNINNLKEYPIVVLVRKLRI